MEDTKATQAASKALEGHDFTQNGDPVARREQRIWYRKGMEMLESECCRALVPLLAPRPSLP